MPMPHTSPTTTAAWPGRGGGRVRHLLLATFIGLVVVSAPFAASALGSDDPPPVPEPVPTAASEGADANAGSRPVSVIDADGRIVEYSRAELDRLRAEGAARYGEDVPLYLDGGEFVPIPGLTLSCEELSDQRVCAGSPEALDETIAAIESGELEGP